MSDTNKNLLLIRQKLEKKIKDLSSELKEINETLWETNKADIEKAFSEKAEPFGVVYVGDVGFEVAKKVVWDQDKLSQVRSKLAEIGLVAESIVQRKYSVSETLYKTLPPQARAVLEDARTVEPGTRTIKIKGE